MKKKENITYQLPGRHSQRGSPVAILGLTLPSPPSFALLAANLETTWPIL